MRSPLTALSILCALVLLTPSSLVAQSSSTERRAGEARKLRDAGRLDDAVALLRTALEQAPRSETVALLLAETLGWQKRFEEAKSIYRDLVRRSRSSAARIGLARVLLWTGEYRESREVALGLLRGGRRDVEAEEIAATAAYWSGDFRSAEREFAGILRLHPERTESRKSLLEIRSAARPQLKVEAELTSDSQPYRIARSSAEGSIFSDPLTRWDATAGTYTIDPVRGRVDHVAPFAGVGAEITIPSLALVIHPRLGVIRFPDGESRLLGGLSGTLRTSRRSRLTLEGRRRELLAGLESSDEHATIDSLGAVFHLEPRPRWIGELRGETLEYSDGNHGESFSAYVLAPLATMGTARMSAGLSGAWRDTDQSRFRIDEIRAERTVDFFTYHYEGVYDPYHTPQSLKEVRVMMSMELTRGRFIGQIRGDLGTARDRATAFGPPIGPTPLPNLDTYALTYSREFHPWRLALAVSLPVAYQFEIHASYERIVTSDYRAHSAHATLVRRF